MKEERQRRGSTLGITRSKGSKTANGKEEGEFDDLISALRTGDVFGEDMAKLNKVRNRRRPSAPAQVVLHNKNINKMPKENGRTSAVISRERLSPQSKLTNGMNGT